MECLTKDDQSLIDAVKSSSPSLGAVLEKRLVPETKSIVKSKLNFTGLVLVFLGMITDPTFKTFFGDLIPPDLLGKIIFVSGWLVIALRTLAKNPKINLNWRNPFEDNQSCD